MSRIIEALKHFLVWLGRSLGLTNRPLPKPPMVPEPQIIDVPVPVGQALRFYGPFIPQWGSFDYREQVTFDFRYQVHGCGNTAQKYGIKDPIKNKIVFELTATNLEANYMEAVLTSDGRTVPPGGLCVDQLYWIPGIARSTTLVGFKAKRSKMGCGTTIPPIVPEPRPAGAKYRLKLIVKAPNGQSWGWEEIVEVTGGPCG